MLYRFLADLTVFVHFAYVLFVIFALLITILGWYLRWDWVRNRWFRGIHLAMILVVALEAWVGVTCPLTTWEQRLRSAAGQQAYQGDFIANWMHDALFFHSPPWVFTLVYTVFAAIVLGTIVLIPPRWKKTANPSKPSA